MNDADRKLLTEYLGECWHDCENDEECSKCKKTLRGYYFGTHRSFTTREDMMACYEAIWKAGEWENFHRRHILSQGFRILEGAFSAWLFCLSGDGYEERCQMMADWIADRAEEGGQPCLTS